MCSFRSCQTRFEFLSQFRKVRNAFECFITQVQTRLPKTKCVWPMKINVICTVCAIINAPKGVKSCIKSRSFNQQWVVFHKLHVCGWRLELYIWNLSRKSCDLSVYLITFNPDFTFYQFLIWIESHDDHTRCIRIEGRRMILSNVQTSNLI